MIVWRHNIHDTKATKSNYGNSKNTGIIHRNCARWNNRLLFAVPLVERRHVVLVALSRSGQLGYFCLVADTASASGWPCLCRLWRCLYLCGADVVVGGRCYPPGDDGLDWGRYLLDRGNRYYVRKTAGPEFIAKLTGVFRCYKWFQTIIWLFLFVPAWWYSAGSSLPCWLSAR